MKQSRIHSQSHTRSSFQSSYSSQAAWSEIDLIGKLADLKQDHYRLTLAVTTLMELLVEKGILQQEDISRKAAELDPYVAGAEYGHPVPTVDIDEFEDEDY